MLELRPSCECCNVDLPPNSTQAVICSFECTFCIACAGEKLSWICPNCGGELLRRPRRSVEKLINSPATNKRTFNPNCCK